MRALASLVGAGYRYLGKPIAFRVEPELVHTRVTELGERLGNRAIARFILSSVFVDEDPILEQSIADIRFKSPIGLAAGFDYDARLTQILPSLGFGFHTVGTITNRAYGGNPPPILGRLPISKSLMVNKGFKNKGAKAIAEKLRHFHYRIPMGISIGRTNDASLTLNKSIHDILEAFTVFERARVQNSYYELNISCPNLYGNVSFYEPANLKLLLKMVDRLNLSCPLFIKMPISVTDEEFLGICKVAEHFSPVGLIIGNLQKDRQDKAFVHDEVSKFPVGNFSGKPTFARSNYLISKTYKLYRDRFVIVGTGGVFNAEDAYLKIKCGASLVQLITGMVYEGPQLISQINSGLVQLLSRDGFKNVREAVGTEGY